MGLPTTWAILSLVHIFWWRESIRTHAKQIKADLKTAFSQNKFLVCGDDGLFIGQRAVYTLYEELVRKCGGVFSPGKHFVSTPKPHFPFLRGVFLERLYQYSIQDGVVSNFMRDSAIPLRGLVRPEVPE